MANPEFSQLIEELYEPLYQFALSLCLTESDACDLSLKAFEIWRSQSYAQADEVDSNTGVFAILHREFLARPSRRQDASELEEDTGTVARTEMEASKINALDGAIIQDALHRLHLRYRAPISLFYLRRHSFGEIGQILDVPVETVLERITRGKAELRKALSYPPDEKAKRSAAKKEKSDGPR